MLDLKTRRFGKTHASYEAAGTPPASLSRSLVESLPDLFARDDHTPRPRTDATHDARKRMRERALMLESDGTEFLSSASRRSRRK